MFNIKILSNKDKGSLIIMEYFPRLLFASIFIFAAIGKFVDTQTIQGFMESNGIPGVLIWGGALTDIALAILIISGRFWNYTLKIGAIYVIILGFLFHFRPESTPDMINLVKNLAIAGAMLLLSKRESKA
jgi:putative oxidoreductase